MFGLGPAELLIIGVLALLFIGPKKLPELARGLGKSLREFQKAKNEFSDEFNSELNAKPKIETKPDALAADLTQAPTAHANLDEKVEAHEISETKKSE